MNLRERPRGEMGHELPLKNFTIIVIGAGPGGMATALAASRMGARTTVLEQAGDPRMPNSGYTNRSFNFTLNRIGKNSLGDERAMEGSTPLVGRAVHDSQTKDVHFSTYGGGSPEDALQSISRPRLRRNLADLAEKEGTVLEFQAKVIEVDPVSGQTVFTKNEAVQKLTADLVVIADGIHSHADQLVKAIGGQVNMRQDEHSFVSVTLDPQASKQLSPRHLHFWHQHEEKSFVVGMPNIEGDIAALFFSSFADIGINDHPFATSTQADIRLRRQFPEMLAIDPTLSQRLPARRRSELYYKWITDFRVGDHVAVVGDAGNAAPPWAGFGANSAIYAGMELVKLLAAHNGNLSPALAEYQKFYHAFSGELQQYVADHLDIIRGLAYDPQQQQHSAPAEDFSRLIQKARRQGENV